MMYSSFVIGYIVLEMLIMDSYDIQGSVVFVLIIIRFNKLEDL